MPPPGASRAPAGVGRAGALLALVAGGLLAGLHRLYSSMPPVAVRAPRPPPGLPPLGLGGAELQRRSRRGGGPAGLPLGALPSPGPLRDPSYPRRRFRPTTRSPGR